MSTLTKKRELMRIRNDKIIFSTQNLTVLSIKCFVIPKMSLKENYVLMVTIAGFCYSFCHSCDIFVASKCPTIPAINEYNQNSTAYCHNMREHVDCINKKLRLCKNIQEYGPALETIKWTLKVMIAQVHTLDCF